MTRASAALRRWHTPASRQTKATAAVGRLAAGVAHDFNNILQTVFGSLELVLEEVPPATRAHELTAIALRAARRGAYLTDHLLSYARQQMLRPQSIALESVLADIEKRLADTLAPEVAIEVRADRTAPMVTADAGQLETALLNLAINAADAMPHGGTLTIEAGTIEAGDHAQAGRCWAVVTVSDTGHGMDAATLARAAEPFFTTKGPNGTGLGLSMVQGFAEQSGGRMRIASTPGKGTTVELLLPQAIEATGLSSDRCEICHGDL